MEERRCKEAAMNQPMNVIVLAKENGQKFVFIPKGKGVLMLPAPDRESLFGIAPGVNAEGYRDRNDRY